MKALELRIGNYLQDRDDNTTRVWMLAEGATGAVNGFDESQEHYPYKPVPLTEDWFIKLGFTWDLKRCNYELGGLILTRWNDPIYQINEDFDTEVKLEYVHQLQNLYFALTSEELITK